MVSSRRKISQVKAGRKGQLSESWCRPSLRTQVSSPEGSKLPLNTLRRRVSSNNKRRPGGRRSTPQFHEGLEASGDQTRLQIKLQPARKFYTCTAKTNRLHVGVFLPNPAAAPASLPVDLVLIYAKTQKQVEDQSILVVYTKLPSLDNGKGHFEFRIEEVSSRHGRRDFAVKIQPRDQRFKPAYTTPIDVKSKIWRRRGKPTALAPNPFPVLSCNHTADCTNCARFLENAVIEIQETMNQSLAAILAQIRNCDAAARSATPSLPTPQPPALPLPPQLNGFVLGPAMNGIPPPLLAHHAAMPLGQLPGMTAWQDLPPPLSHMPMDTSGDEIKSEGTSDSEGHSSADDEVASWLKTPGTQ